MNLVKEFRTFICILMALLLALIGMMVVSSWLSIPVWSVVIDIIRMPFSSATKYFDVIAAWMPLLMTVAAILFSFRAGFWNIGAEGQIIIGAVMTTWIVRSLQGGPLPSFLIILLGLLFGAIGGGIWAFLSAFMKTNSGVHEIVSGIGLNVAALAISNYLVLIPWKRTGAISSIGGTDMFVNAVWLPQIGSLRVSFLTIFIGAAVFIFVAFFIHRTKIGLQLAAFQINPNAKYIHARFTSSTIWQTFILSGAIAGFTGAVLTLGTYHRLIPSVSNGLGYLAILIVLMVNQKILWAAVVAFLFAMTNINGTQLAINYQLPSAFVGAFQALWALLTMIILQFSSKLFPNRDRK